jgi:hypothetical protein
LIILISILFAIGILLLTLLKIPAVSDVVFKKVVMLKNRFCMHKQIVAGWSGWLFFEPELTYVTNPLPPENVQRIIAFDRILRQQGITLFVVPIPNKIDVYPEKFTLLPAPHPVKKERTEMLKQLENAGVRVVDIVPAFEREKAFNQLFDPYETHWTALGIEIAAQTIAQRMDSALSARSLSRDTRYGASDTILQTRGDLLEKLHENRPTTWYPFPVKRVLNPDGSPYTDDRASEILILGDSFVNHGKWWNAHLGAQLARLLGHPTRTYFSLLANTEGPCMYKIQPGVFPHNGIVIWAFTSRVLQYPMGDPRLDHPH